MSGTHDPDAAIHAPWFVEGRFDVHLYYHDWPDPYEPTSPTVIDSDVQSSSSARTVEYIRDDNVADGPPLLRLSFYVGTPSLQLIEPDPSHTTECMARHFLRVGSFFEDQLSSLWDLLPHDSPRGHQTFFDGGSTAAFSFTTGAFQAGGLVGVRSNALQMPWVTALLCRIVHSVLLGEGAEDHHFTSLSLLRNVHSGIHRDGNNHPSCNSLLIPLSRFSGGELWCYNAASGDVCYPGTDLPGLAHAVTPPFLEFDSHELHGTLHWTGIRVVLAVYHMKTPDALSDGEMQFLRQVLPFGAKPSVQGFCRASGAIWAVGQALLHIHWSVFFDDYVVVASPEEKGHLDLVLRSYFALVGWETSDEKDAGFKSVAKALGVEFSLGEIHLGLLRVQNTEARKRELVSTIESIVQQGGAHAKELECLRGRLQFAESQVFGRGAAQRMRAISKAMKLSGFVALDDSLTEALLFLKDRVLHGEARIIRACDRPTYHLFTDASYEADMPAGLGGILYSDGGLLLRWYSESADTDVLEAINKEGKQGLIYELEACAAVQGVVQLCSSLNDCNLICYDNEAALAALIKCASESPVVASQLNKLSMLEDEKGISIWFERVESSANPADDPSRFVLSKLPVNFRVRWIPGEELLF
ncbi:unnamed protein product [Symbiodinium sp. CCMP2592]|nr:unnamed protein product [Symbiodinium sp. CCMP2592]